MKNFLTPLVGIIFATSSCAPVGTQAVIPLPITPSEIPLPFIIPVTDTPISLLQEPAIVNFYL